MGSQKEMVCLIWIRSNASANGLAAETVNGQRQTQQPLLKGLERSVGQASSTIILPKSQPTPFVLRYMKYVDISLYSLLSPLYNLPHMAVASTSGI